MTTTDTAIRVSRLIKADPATVFEAWTRPEQLRQWSAPEGMDVDPVDVDLRVGGAYRICMKNPDGSAHTAFGVYREIEPPRRLSYTWAWEEAGDEASETLVTVEFHDRGGSTEVILTHELFPDTETAGKHEQGWTSCLNRLEKLF